MTARVCAECAKQHNEKVDPIGPGELAEGICRVCEAYAPTMTVHDGTLCAMQKARTARLVPAEPTVQQIVDLERELQETLLRGIHKATSLRERMMARDKYCRDHGPMDLIALDAAMADVFIRRFVGALSALTESRRGVAT